MQTILCRASSRSPLYDWNRRGWASSNPGVNDDGGYTQSPVPSVLCPERDDAGKLEM